MVVRRKKLLRDGFIKQYKKFHGLMVGDNKSGIYKIYSVAFSLTGRESYNAHFAKKIYELFSAFGPACRGAGR